MIEGFHNTLSDIKRNNGRDLTVFLLSLLCAYMIWLIHNLSIEGYYTVSIPVVALSDIEGHSPVSSNCVEIDVRCLASGWQIMGMRMSYVLKGHREVKFSKDDFTRISGNEYEISADALAGYASSIFPDISHYSSMETGATIFRFPEMSSKRVPIRVNSDVKYASQYMPFGPMKLTPDSVTVYAPLARLRDINYVVTEMLWGAKVQKNIGVTARLEEPSGVRLSTESVYVSQRVSRYVGINKRIRIEVKNKPVNKVLFLNPNAVDVNFNCVFPPLLNPLDNFKLYIDYNDFEQSINGRCLVKCDSLPNGIISYKPSVRVVDCVESAI